MGALSDSTARISVFSLIFLSFSILCAGSVLGASVSLNWQANSEPDIAYYLVSWGTSSRQYSNTARATGTTYTVTNLEDAQTYYFAVQAVDRAGQKSEYSDEVSVFPSQEANVESAGPLRDVADPASNPDWLELGTVSVDSNWKRVELHKTFTDPVVIVGPPSQFGPDPAVVRLRNITADSFEIRIQEWNYLNGTHTFETVPYMVVDVGSYRLPDGSLWEAGTYEINGTLNWKDIQLNTPFENSPLIFQAVQTYNGSDTVVTRLRNISADGFQSALQEEEALNDGHSTERVGYLAISKESQAVFTKRFLLGHEWSPVDPMVSAFVHVEEEQSYDDEVSHVEEDVAIMAVNGLIFGQMQSMNGGNTASLRLYPLGSDWLEMGAVSVDSQWKEVELSREFQNPVVIVGPPSHNGYDPCVVRLRNITGRSFEIRLQEWTYLNGTHVSETVPYLIVEAGTHRTVDGSLWQAGIYDMDGTLAWRSLEFNLAFDNTPLLFQSVQTYNGNQPVVVRQKSITDTGFVAALQEEDALNDGHATEQIGYLAIYSSKPYLFINSMDLSSEWNPVHEKVNQMLRLEEEKSLDSETGHVNEDVAVMFLNGNLYAHPQSFNGADTVGIRRAVE